MTSPVVSPRRVLADLEELERRTAGSDGAERVAWSDGWRVARRFLAERLMQIAFVLPCAMLLGWAAGWAVDHYFHMHWAIGVGLVLGIVAGMVSAIRMAMQAMNPPRGVK